MSYALTDLVGMVRIAIRDNGTPQAFPDSVGLSAPAVVPNNSPELTQFVIAALAEYSRYRPLKKRYTLNLTTNQQTYTLPADWMTVEAVSFERATRPQHVPDRDEFLLPFIEVAVPLGGQRLHFDWYDDQQQIVLSVAPIADSTLTFDYFALHNSSTVPKQWVDVAILPACERALRALATDQTVKLQLYRIANGKLEVDNRTIKDALLKQADEYRERFRREVVMRPQAGIG